MGVRIDKWLWAARFFKTRSLAQQAVEGGKVRVNGERVKPARELRAGDPLTVMIGEAVWDIRVLLLSDTRGPAPVARTLYAESAEGAAQRKAQAVIRRLSADPARDLHGRPTKRDRRQLERWRDGQQLKKQ